MIHFCHPNPALTLILILFYFICKDIVYIVYSIVIVYIIVLLYCYSIVYTI